MNIKERIRQAKLDIALNRINRQCAILEETTWPDMAREIRGHIDYIADAENQRRKSGLVPSNK